MKTPYYSLLLLLPLAIFVFTINSSEVLAASSPEAVRDTSGKEVRTGKEYYILPVIRGNGGGLTLGAPRNGSCPLDVIQDPNELSNGLPLTFTPVNPKKGIVRINTDLNIKFSAATICIQSTVWRLEFDQSLARSIVTTGGVEGNPGSSTFNNWFSIEKDDDDYKLVFCPNVVCTTGICHRPLCGDLGIYIVDGVRRLTLGTEQPLKVMFKRV